MIDTLCAFGCSNTFGCESLAANDRSEQNIFHAYPYFLSQKLKIPNYLNFAKGGASNLEIAYKVIEYVLTLPKDKSNIFLVIGWTGNARFSFLHKKKIKSVQYINDESIEARKRLHNIIDGKFGCEKLFAKLILPFEEKFQKKDNLNIIRELMSIYFFYTELCTVLNVIIRFAISAWLDRCNISYITLPTILYANHPLYDSITKIKNIQSYNENNKIVFDFNNFKQQERIKQDHLTESEHYIVADYLYNYIINTKTYGIFPGLIT
jgi:hypothetical protein